MWTLKRAERRASHFFRWREILQLVPMKFCSPERVFFG